MNGQKVYETTLYAYPKPGYVFKGWTLASGSEASGSVATDSIVYKDSPFVVDVTEERIIYIANFKLKNSITNEDVDFVGHATGIMNKLDVLADRYFDDGAFSADRSTVESKAAEAMARTDYLRIAPYSSASAMINALQEELKIPVRKSANSIGDLGTNLVSSDGEIIPLKKQTVDDSITAAADETIEDKYGSLYKATVIMAAEPLLPADFADGKRTLLWSDTGVDKKDRLIIIQQILGMDDIVLTPIADSKGRAKFTAPGLAGSKLILVKVDYKQSN